MLLEEIMKISSSKRDIWPLVSKSYTRKAKMIPRVEVGGLFACSLLSEWHSYVYVHSNVCALIALAVVRTSIRAPATEARVKARRSKTGTRVTRRTLKGWQWLCPHPLSTPLQPLQPWTQRVQERKGTGVWVFNTALWIWPGLSSPHIVR